MPLAGPICVVLLQLAALDGDTERKYLSRLAEEAEVFARLAPKVIGQERLDQRTVLNPPRFRPRLGKTALEPNAPRFHTREVVSEYGFSAFKEAPGDIREMRQVVSVDGKQVTAPEKARETLTAGITSDDDKRKKRMLLEFESYGLVGAATDFGQVILLFRSGTIRDYRFAFKGRGMVGAEPVAVLTFEQFRGSHKLLIIEGKASFHEKLKGEVWVRAADGLPLRITLTAARADKSLQIRDLAVVDYQPTGFGLVLPAAVQYDRYAGTALVTENRFYYNNFRMFGASSEVKFTIDP